MINYNPLGKTLHEVAIEYSSVFSHWSIFVLKDSKDNVGVEVATPHCLHCFLSDYPHYNNHVVMHNNDFFGIQVLRVYEPLTSEIDKLSEDDKSISNVHGHWILNKTADEYTCDRCSNVNTIDSDTCPNCKAVMDGVYIPRRFNHDRN